MLLLDSCVVELQNVVELRVVDVLHYVFSDSLQLYIILQHSTIQNITFSDSDDLITDLITGLTGQCRQEAPEPMYQAWVEYSEPKLNEIITCNTMNTMQDDARRPAPDFVEFL